MLGSDIYGQQAVVCSQFLVFFDEKVNKFLGFGNGNFEIIVGVYLLPTAIDDERVFTMKAAVHNFINYCKH